MTKTPKALYAQADPGSGGVAWTLDDKLPVKKNDKKTIDFPKNSGEYAVTVNLIDNTGTGIVFKQADPIWVQVDGCCPPGQGVNSTEIQDIQAGTSTLQFTNTNQVAGKLIYQLNFVDSAGVDISPQLDPEFKNGGTGGRPTAALIITGVVVATALVVVLALNNMDKLGQ